MKHQRTIIILFLPFATQAFPASTETGRLDVLRTFAARYATEIHPLVSRPVNGCKGCHTPQSKRMFRVLDTPRSTFSDLLEQELFDLQDPMFILQRLLSKDADLHMPKAGTWTMAEIERFRVFAADLDKAMAKAAGGDKADERIPDSLLLPFDGAAKKNGAARIKGYYELRKSSQAIFGGDWLAASGADPFAGKAQIFGGADFKTSFELSRTPSANYLSGLQEVAREIARRFVSAAPAALFPGFDPNVQAAGAASGNVDVLYRRILFRDPSPAERMQALKLVAGIQQTPVADRQVRFTLKVRDAEGLEDSATVDVNLLKTRALVSRYQIDQSGDAGPGGRTWVRVGDGPFRFAKDDRTHKVRLVDVPGNHVTVFDALKLVRVRNGVETGEEILIDNSDPECDAFGDWRAIPKAGAVQLGGKVVKKYEIPLSVNGPNHLESRNLNNELRYVDVALRLAETGDYNVYLTWPAVPNRARAAIVEVHAATRPGASKLSAAAPTHQEGRYRRFMDQTESTLNEEGDTQWQVIYKRAYFAGNEDYVEISNDGIDSSKFVIVADAVRFESLEGKPEIVADNENPEGFETSEGWAPDQIGTAAKGRGVMHGKDMMSYPAAKDGRVDKKLKVDPAQGAWARFRPIRNGKYEPGWYKVAIWFTGGVTHTDWVPVDIRASRFAPVAAIERVPVFGTGEIARLNASLSHHPKGSRLQYFWSHDAGDLGIRLTGASGAVAEFRVPDELPSARAGWAGLIEGLLQHPEFVIPPSGPGSSRGQKLTRAALDLVGRVPTVSEIRRYRQVGRLEPMVDAYLASDDFRDYFFYRTRATLMSRGTDETDEPARLWTYIATRDLSYRDLFTADYAVDAGWNKVSRPAEHGSTGILTMKGYLKGKPGLPHFTYPAQVLTFALGVAFEVSDAVSNARKTVVSTTDPASICYSCHKLLTPLALQRQRWDDNGAYRVADTKGVAIDESDQNVIPSYPFKGPGLESFARQVVRKEKFVRNFINTHYDMVFHRRLRALEDERSKYKLLYDHAVASDLRIRPLLKQIMLMENGEEMIARRLQ